MATNREQQDRNQAASQEPRSAAPASSTPSVGTGVIVTAAPQPKQAAPNASLGDMVRGLDQLAQKMAAGAGNTSDGHAGLVAEVSALRDKAAKALDGKEDPTV